MLIIACEPLQARWRAVDGVYPMQGSMGPHDTLTWELRKGTYPELAHAAVKRRRVATGDERVLSLQVDTELAVPALINALPWAASDLATAWASRRREATGDCEDVVSFADAGYSVMAEDTDRTSKYAEAIHRRLASQPGRLVVLDLGTGGLALLALMAARAGAKRVYAIETNAGAARRAREAVAAATDVPAGTVVVLEGHSTAITLPEKVGMHATFVRRVIATRAWHALEYSAATCDRPMRTCPPQVDLLVTEIFGSVATEECLRHTLWDAQRRHVRRPHDAASYIPARVQTLVAPASYALHHLLPPPLVTWPNLRRLPLRLESNASMVQPLAPPQPVEDIVMSEHHTALEATSHSATLRFAVDAGEVAAAKRVYANALREEGMEPLLADETGATVAHSFSGARCERACAAGPYMVASGLRIAIWPVIALRPPCVSAAGAALWLRLDLDGAGDLIVESRGDRHAPIRSHWPTVLPLLSDSPIDVAPGERIQPPCSPGKRPSHADRPAGVAAGDEIDLAASFEYPPSPFAFPVYTLRAQVLRRAERTDGAGTERVHVHVGTDGAAFPVPSPERDVRASRYRRRRGTVLQSMAKPKE